MAIVYQYFSQFLFEILMIAGSLAVFIMFLGVKMACPYCGARFTYRHDLKNCPKCNEVLGYDGDGTGKQPDGLYNCPFCGHRFYFKVGECPNCRVVLGQEFFEDRDEAIKQIDTDSEAK